MFNIPDRYIHDLLIPLIAAQFYLVILTYFFIVRKRIASCYKFYVCFLITFIIFLAGRSFQQFSTITPPLPVLYFRMFLLFSIGTPSLLVAATIQSGINLPKKYFILPYLTGLIISLGYSICHGPVGSDLLCSLGISKKMITASPIPITIHTAHSIQLAGAILLLVIPCTYLLIKEITGNRKPPLMAFLVGTIIFGVAMVIGTYNKNFSQYYLISILSACCWGWAMYYDIRNMKGTATLLKEELQLLVHSGNTAANDNIRALLSNLEELSRGNLAIYKIRVREIMCMLTDTTISAGGDVQELVKRNNERERAIEQSSTPESLNEIIYTEAVEMSSMISEIPNQQNSSIEKAIKYIHDNYQRDFGVDEVAEVVGLSRAYFMRLFKKETSQTVNQYLTEIRIDHAKELLKTKNVTETAFAVGFNNSNYFGAVFKKNTGMTPGQFQENLKK